MEFLKLELLSPTQWTQSSQYCENSRHFLKPFDLKDSSISFWNYRKDNLKMETLFNLQIIDPGTPRGCRAMSQTEPFAGSGPSQDPQRVPRPHVFWLQSRNRTREGPQKPSPSWEPVCFSFFLFFQEMVSSLHTCCCHWTQKKNSLSVLLSTVDNILFHNAD